MSKTQARVLVKPSTNDPLVVLQSSFWHFNTIGVHGATRACVIDPGIYPDEIDALRETVTAGGTRNVTDVVLTHSHHDHIRGWQRFGDARVHFPRVAANKAPGPQARILAAKTAIDQRIGVDDPTFGYPQADAVFDELAHVELDGIELELRFLPGHSDCTSVVWIPSLRTLCSADYLVSPGLPYCRFQARMFESALATLKLWTDELGIERVIPAHNALLQGRGSIDTALEIEIDYFARMRERAQSLRPQAESREALARTLAREAIERRGVDLGGKERQDFDNAKRLVAEEWPRA